MRPYRSILGFREICAHGYEAFKPVAASSQVQQTRSVLPHNLSLIFGPYNLRAPLSFRRYFQGHGVSLCGWSELNMMRSEPQRLIASAMSDCSDSTAQWKCSR